MSPGAPTNSPACASVKHSPATESRASETRSSVSSSTQEMRDGLVPRNPGGNKQKPTLPQVCRPLARPTSCAGSKGRAGRAGRGPDQTRGLTDRTQVAIGLAHHVPVQGPLRGPQRLPFFRGEVHGHVREAHTLSFPALELGPVWSR